MTREEFYAICEKVVTVYEIKNIENKREKYFTIKEMARNEAFMQRGAKIGQKLIYVEWLSGGQDGGSCFDDGKSDPYYPVTPDPKPSFDDLDLVIEAVCPTISFMMYKRTVKDLIENGSYIQREYYGNYSNYSVEYVLLDKLYDKINVVMKASGENK